MLALLAGLLLLSAGPVAAQSDAADEPEPPPLRSTLLWNTLLPGTAQIALGQQTEGRLILAGSLTLRITGLGLLLWQQLDGAETGGGLGIYSQDGRTYLFPPDEDGGLVGSDWRYNAGLAIATWGSLLTAYSQWAGWRDLSDLYELPAPRRGRESLGDLLLAPYRPENVFTFDFFPVFPLTILGQMSPDDIAVYGDFFRRDHVDFWGLEVSPWAGLALNTLFTLGLVHANATAEEILYRGFVLEQRGVVRSSLSFGAAHLPNMLVPGVSVEDTLYQTLFATLFGFYAANRAEANGYDFSRMVALHFWHNVFAFTAGYLEEQALPALTWSVRLSY